MTIRDSRVPRSALATLLLTPELPGFSSRLLQRSPGELDPEPSQMRERRVVRPAFAGAGGFATTAAAAAFARS